MTQNEAKVQIQGQGVAMMQLIATLAAYEPAGSLPPYSAADPKWQRLTAAVYQGIKVANNGLALAFSDHGPQGAADGWPDPVMLPDAANPVAPAVLPPAVQAAAGIAGAVVPGVAPIIASVAHLLTPSAN